MSNSICSGTGDDAQVKGSGVKAKAQLRLREKDRTREEKADGSKERVLN